MPRFKAGDMIISKTVRHNTSARVVSSVDESESVRKYIIRRVRKDGTLGNKCSRFISNVDHEYILVDRLNELFKFKVGDMIRPKPNTSSYRWSNGKVMVRKIDVRRGKYGISDTDDFNRLRKRPMFYKDYLESEYKKDQNVGW